MDRATLPQFQCRHATLGPLTADPAAPVWRRAEAFGLRGNTPGEVSVQGTRVRSLWDDTFWAVLFEAEAANPWATLTRRNAPLWTEEVVEVFIDPVGDLESYFEVEINPLGTVVDLVLRRTQSGWRKNFAWQVDGLQSMVRRTDTGWAAELRIPFSSVAANTPVPGMFWRANFLRIDRPAGPGTEGTLSAWSPTGVRNFHRPEFFGTMEFLA